ncbi:hypothetical protein [Butyrivibrio sp. JL13D10]|uniref:hypothetical protein n=1 Tax=Butyrivibrio sp. JL13D10 TaxID=3236815 RepID=UPI0038B56BCE
MKRRRKSKSYNMGMLTLIFLCAIYLVVYPQFKAFDEPGDSGVTDSASFYETADNSALTDGKTDDEATAAAEAAISAIQEKEKTAGRKSYTFRSESSLDSHFEKHGDEMGFSTKEEYLAAANALINNPSALHKNEAEDGDDIYYLEATDEIAFVSTDGFIRTYYICSGKAYFDRQ